MSKRPVICSVLKRLHDNHRFSANPFGALEDFQVLLGKAKRLTIRELSRKTPDSAGAKFLIASAALRVYRNRHLGTLMRCCEAWKPIPHTWNLMGAERGQFHLARRNGLRPHERDNCLMEP